MIGRSKKRRAKPKWETVSEPNDTRMGKVWQALECLEREIWRSKQLEEPPPYEKACLLFYFLMLSINFGVLYLLHVIVLCCYTSLKSQDTLRHCTTYLFSFPTFLFDYLAAELVC